MKKYIPKTIRYHLALLLKMIFDRNAFLAHKDYVSTDYRQKCVHIMEAMNYAKIALLPKVYLEFGCHSGRTFSAAIRASRELSNLGESRALHEFLDENPGFKVIEWKSYSSFGKSFFVTDVE